MALPNLGWSRYRYANPVPTSSVPYDLATASSGPVDHSQNSVTIQKIIQHNMKQACALFKLDVIYLFIYLFVRSLFLSFFVSFVRSFIHSLVRSFVRPLVRSSVRRFVSSLVR